MEDVARSSFRIKRQILLKIKLLALYENKSMSKIISEALTEYLQKHEDELKKPREI